MINFMKYRVVTALVSLTILGGTAGLALYNYVTRGQIFNYSIEFTQGTQVMMKFSQPVSAEEVRKIVENAGWEGASMREFGPQDLLVRVKETSKDPQGLARRIIEKITQAMPGVEVTEQGSEMVGPGVGEEMRSKAFWAIILSLIAMLIYIAITFWSFAFASGAVVSLFHDAVVMVGIYLLVNRDISLNVIGAIMAVLGYSINDTIVIFAQIRNNLKKMHGVPLVEVVNVSINQTLRRTVLTTLSTALVVAAMFILGGEALRDLSLTLLVGIIFGVYSTVYIASPVMMLFYREKHQA